jgi:hypothetical protein
VGSESGRLFKVEEAQTNNPVVTEIGNIAFPTASISSIAIGKSEDTLMVTFSNYGVVSVWQTYNGGSNWRNVEGNLPDMPIRWALFHPQNNRQALLATETGVWECVNLTLNPVEWKPVTDGMANVRVDMLQLRKSDNLVLAATHGRGLFTMTWDISTGTPERSAETFSVYPNPSTGAVNISGQLNQPGKLEIIVSDMQGKQLLNVSQDAIAGPYHKQINLGGQPKGTYLVMSRNGGKVVWQKVIVY